MSRRLYLGRLPPDTRPEDITKHFDGYGRIVDCRVMTGFGFVEFESNKDADDVVHAFNGKPLMGQSIIVEFAKDTRRRDPDPRHPPPRPRRAAGFRINIMGISRDTSWQDLKDFGREAGSVTYADVDRDGSGVLEYPTLEDAELAVKQLDGRDLRGVAVKLSLDDSRGGGGGGGGGRDRDRSPPRRDRSPGYRREYRDDRERRRSRSPPPPRRYEERRYDDRRDDRDRDYRRGDRDKDRDMHRDKDRDLRRDDRDDRDRGDAGWDSKR